MSRKTGRTKRLQFYDHGNVACPICLTAFTRDEASSGAKVTLEHVPPKSVGGQARCLTCKACNAGTGRSFDQVAALVGRERVPVTVNILGKRDTFMLSLDGKPLTQPFGGYSRQDFERLANSPAKRFSMSVRVPSRKAVAASSLKAAYLALFSLLGRQAGYDYVRGNALAPIRQLMIEPPRDGAIGRYVTKAPENLPDPDIFLISEPVPSWLVRVESDMVMLPLSGESATSTPLWDWRKRNGDEAVPITAPVSWMFQSFGALHTINVHLAGAGQGRSTRRPRNPWHSAERPAFEGHLHHAIPVSPRPCFVRS